MLKTLLSFAFVQKIKTWASICI